MLDQASSVVGIGVDSSRIVLWTTIELAPRKTTSIVGNHGHVLRQIFRHGVERIGRAVRARDHEQQRTAAADLVIQSSAGYLECAHHSGAAPLVSGKRNAPSWPTTVYTIMFVSSKATWWLMELVGTLVMNCPLPSNKPITGPRWNPWAPKMNRSILAL